MVLVLIAITCLLGISPTLLLASSATNYPPVAKPGCEAKCGSVTIPFPFGIGSNCSIDKWFEIECVNNSRPYLKDGKIEVLNINLTSNQYIQVRNPISFHNCANKTATKAVNFTGTPFYISSDNIFVAVSCDVLAKLHSNSGRIFSESWCASTCSSGDNVDADRISTSGYRTSCNGIDCCEVTSTRSIMDAINISFDNSTSTSTAHDNDPCKFAFIVDREYWYEYKNHSTSFTRIRNMDSVPLNLEWLLNYSDYDIFNTDMSKSKTINCYNPNSFSSGDSTYRKGPPLRCSCMGFRGNPYLIDGCVEDVNECKEHPGMCTPGGTCVNTHGSFYCSRRRKLLLIGFGSAFGALFLLFSTWGLFKLIKKRRESKRKKMFFKRNGGLLLQQQISSDEGNVKKTKLFTSTELTKATDHFSIERVLGQGGQGTVYKGMLEDGKIVAVKKSKVVDEEKLSEFINEVVILSQINHRNVVQLLGCCLETEVPLLVYEFIPNGTLSQYIHEQKEEFSFTWKMRVRIATEVAGALSYLHSAASFPIYHRDIKSTNVLLDEKYKAKVADFGTSRTISIEQTHLTTLVYGTFGYLDPEYFQSSQFTEKSDVYSFGVVLVELLTGQKAICATRAEEDRNLATYFTMSMEANCLFDIVDAKLLEDGPREEILLVACLALRCLSLSGRNRPTMKEVAMELEGMQKSERKAPFTSQQNYEEIEYVRTELIEPWDAASMSTGSLAFENPTRASLQQELPLLSFESK